MKKTENTNEKKINGQKKYIALYGVTTALLVCLIFSFVGYRQQAEQLKAVEEDIKNAYSAGVLLTSDVLEEQLKEYVVDYFETETLSSTITDEDLKQLTAMISSEVINNLPSEFSEEELNEIRNMIAESVTEAVYEMNSSIESTNEEITIVNDSLKAYIDETIVPRLTLLIEINTGRIDDLKAAFDAFSATYATEKIQFNVTIDDIYARLQNISQTGATVNDITIVNNNIEELVNVMNEYIENNDNRITNVEKELAIVEEQIVQVQKDLQTIFQEQLNNIKTTLTQQVLDNAEISEEERDFILSIIESLNSDTVKSFEDAKAQLEEALANSNLANSEALNNAIGGLQSSLDDIYEELSKQSSDLSEQITNNSNEINNIYNRLGNCQFEYRDGHLHADYYVGTPDAVSFRLDY